MTIYNLLPHRTSLWRLNFNPAVWTTITNLECCKILNMKDQKHHTKIKITSRVTETNKTLIKDSPEAVDLSLAANNSSNPWLLKVKLPKVWDRESSSSIHNSNKLFIRLLQIKTNNWNSIRLISLIRTNPLIKMPLFF